MLFSCIWNMTTRVPCMEMDFFWKKTKPKSSFLSISRFSYLYLNSFGVLIYFNSFIYKNNSKRKQDFFLLVFSDESGRWHTMNNSVCMQIDRMNCYTYIFVCVCVPLYTLIQWKISCIFNKYKCCKKKKKKIGLMYRYFCKQHFAFYWICIFR